MLPAILSELLAIAPRGTRRAHASALVPADLLRETLLQRVERTFPRARIVAPFHLYRGRVDVAIFDRDVTIGVMLEPSEPFGAGLRTGGGTEAFDYAVALTAYPKDHLLETKPPNVWGFRAYLGFDGGVVFELARAASAAVTPCAAVRARLAARAARRPAAILDGDAVADALVAHVEAQYAALAIAREFACGGSVADVAVITPAELHLFEIKGASDGAARLARQSPNYDRVATTCTLVTTCNHRSFRRRVPEHWGILEAALVRGRVRFMQLRTAQSNPYRSVAQLVELLDGTDLRAILRSLDVVAFRGRTITQLRSSLLEAGGEREIEPLALRALAHRARPA